MRKTITHKYTLAASLVIALTSTSASAAKAPKVFSEDVVIQGSICTGFDCAKDEKFDFDTLRLKENNIRIHFQDTSSSSKFTSNDWRIIINESKNGGANFFAIEDATATKIPFKIEAKAPANSLIVNANGKMGFGTAVPATKLHAVSGNSPALRLEQDGSSGFSAQSWDMGANEKNFFIRNANNNVLPFRIVPNSPQNSIFINSNGVGIGNEKPSAKLHVAGTAVFTSTVGLGTVTPDAKLHVAHTNATTKDGNVHIEGNTTIGGVLATSKYTNVDITIADLSARIADLEKVNKSLKTSNEDLENRLLDMEIMLEDIEDRLSL
ncbi:hypothetical protein [Pseudoalteromonas denitrificans]|uniref:Uncharacterized protein n=1 Tax=Pseudoalteromonas denitrificans DSM 6059 TaxID=1123010 RepID=A0A1I1U9P1_9GAMM|nr:hypothetical protein [Pseudoalteromonas denitrificans]SFD67355.1 hypothetical protein SAMN02745724_05156 [Pseudoalteromonas denitrificans DSM 6059]